MMIKGSNFATTCIFLVVLGLAGCGGDIDPSDTTDPERAARAPLPEHDTEATHRGQTAAELGQRLEAQLESGMGMMTLERIAEMGVDGLPARESVRRVFQASPPPEVERSRVDLVRAMALATLVQMQAPEAPALARQAVLDKDFTAFSPAQGIVIRAAVASMDAAELQSDLLALVDDDPAHAGWILRAEGLPEPGQQALAVALLDADLDDETARFLIRRLNELNFTDDQKIQHLLSYREIAAENRVGTHGMLVRIGTREALDAALQIGDPSPTQRADLIRRFDLKPDDETQASEARSTSMDAILGQAMETRSAMEFREAVNGMERLDRENEELRGEFISAMIELSTAAAVEGHRALALSRLGLYLRRNREVPLQPSLGVLLAAAGNPNSPDLVREAAQKTFSDSSRAMINRDPEGYFRAVWPLVVEMTDDSDFDLPATVMMQMAGFPDHARLVIDIVTEDAGKLPDSWAVNPIAAILMHTASIRQLNSSPRREAASITLGRLLASPHASIEYLEPHLMEHMNAIATFNNNTVAGMAGLIGPTIFAEHQAMHREFRPEALASLLETRPRWFRNNPEAIEEWKQFLSEVVAAERAHFSDSAQAALEAL
ncbi:MAG: hypothetical protein EA370_13310 [Wenzhouxiangella sp.]|nr:MAG: hypothetical protein EA370_13310 [Wenzhouxiangella sp.]